MKDIVIGIPGHWTTHQDLYNTINSHKELNFRNGIITDTLTRRDYSVEIYEYDSSLHKAFNLASNQNIEKECLKAIESHTYTLYFIAQGGSPALAQEAMDVSNKLLQCGGLALKVESSGIAHSKQRWQEFKNQNDISALYRAYVTLAGDDSTHYSCGMHNLGYCDAFLTREKDPKIAARTLKSFLLYILNKNSEIANNDLFSLTSESTIYRVIKEKCKLYSIDEPFYNPFGMWTLIPDAYGLEGLGDPKQPKLRFSAI